MVEPSPLHGDTQLAGAVLVEEAGWLMPLHFGNAQAEYAQAHERAVLSDLSHRGKVELAGPDAVRFLHNLCTNDIVSLPVGAGCEAFLANLQARVVAHVFAHRLRYLDASEGLWLDTAPGMGAKVHKHLDHYLISERVELFDRTAEYAQLAVIGPGARAILERVLPNLPELPRFRNTVLPHGKIPVQVRHQDILNLPGYDLVCPREEAGHLWQTIREQGALPAGLAAWERLRVEAGLPEDGKDIDENTLAPEVGRTAQAICYTKGCYLGQEPIVRIRDLGHVNRTLRGLLVDGEELLPSGTKVHHEGKEIGRVTSSVVDSGRGKILALAYIRRGHEAGMAVEVETAAARRAAVVSSLPFSGPALGAP